MKTSLLRILFMALAFLSYGRSQSIWIQRSQNSMIRMDYLTSNFESTFSGYEYKNQTLSLNGKIPIAEIARVAIEVPMIWETMTTPATSETKNGVGNIYIGFDLGNIDSPVFFEVGARPLMRQDLNISGYIGYLSDFDRGEMYIKEMSSYHIAVNVGSIKNVGFVYRVRIGPSLWVPEKGDATTLIDYAAKVGFDNNAVSLNTGLTGRWNTEQDNGKKAFHHLAFDLGYRFQNVRPAFFYRIPLDEEINKIVKRTMGVNVSVEL